MIINTFRINSDEKLSLENKFINFINLQTYNVVIPPIPVFNDENKHYIQLRFRRTLAEISWMFFIYFNQYTEKSDTSDEKVDIENNKFNFSKEPIDIINVIIEYRYYYKISILLEKVLLSTLLVIKF